MLTEMSGLDFALFCLAATGMTLIVVDGAIFQPFRLFLGGWAEKRRQVREQIFNDTGRLPRRTFVEWLNELVNCAQCTGFWCGLFCGLLLTDRREMSGGGQVAFLFCLAAAGSFLSSLGSNLIEWIFYNKMNALRLLEEQNRKLADDQHATLMHGAEDLNTK